MSVSTSSVGVVEGVEEVVEEVARARVAMRLERDDQAAAEALACRAQRGADLRRVMAVVVDHQDAALLAAHLEAAMDAAELLERVRGDARTGSPRSSATAMAASALSA